MLAWSGFLFRSDPNSFHGVFDAPLVHADIGRWCRDGFGGLWWGDGDRDGVFCESSRCGPDFRSVDASFFGSFWPAEWRSSFGASDGADGWSRGRSHVSDVGRPDGVLSLRPADGGSWVFA